MIYINCPECHKKGLEVEMKELSTHVGSHIFDSGPKKGGRHPKQREDKLLVCPNCGYESGRIGREPY